MRTHSSRLCRSGLITRVGGGDDGGYCTNGGVGHHFTEQVIPADRITAGHLTAHAAHAAGQQ